MASNNNVNSGKTIQQSDQEAMAIVFGAIIIVGIFALLWWKERQVFSLPLGYYLLAQLYIIDLFHPSLFCQEWINYTQNLLSHQAGLKNVPPGYFVEGFGYASYNLWWLYLIILWGLGFWLLVASSAENEFTGQFHPTGREYVKEWQFGRGRAPDWMAGCLDAAEAYHRNHFKRIFGEFLLRTTGAKRIETTREVGRSFIAYQARVWGLLKPISVWDPFDTIPELLEVKRPEIWARDNGIISEEVMTEILSRTQNWSQSSALPYNTHKAKRIFESQTTVGGRWAGVHKLPPYMKAIVAICHFNRTNRQSTAVHLAYACAEASMSLFRLRANASRQAIDSAKADVNAAILKILSGQHDNDKLPTRDMLTPEVIDNIDRLLEGYWWKRTALVALLGLSGPHLRWGGESAILQPANFQWVQSVDRLLYLSLNCVGGETWHAEVAGIIAQYQIETLHKRHFKARLGNLERSLRNSLEGISYHAEEQKISVEQAMSDQIKSDHLRLKEEIKTMRSMLKREPDLNVNGPLNWLEALITQDRNEPGLDFLYEEETYE